MAQKPKHTQVLTISAGRPRQKTRHWITRAIIRFVVVYLVVLVIVWFFSPLLSIGGSMEPAPPTLGADPVATVQTTRDITIQGLATLAVVITVMILLLWDVSRRVMGKQPASISPMAEQERRIKDSNAQRAPRTDLPEIAPGVLLDEDGELIQQGSIDEPEAGDLSQK